MTMKILKQILFYIIIFFPVPFLDHIPVLLVNTVFMFLWAWFVGDIRKTINELSKGY